MKALFFKEIRQGKMILLFGLGLRLIDLNVVWRSSLIYFLRIVAGRKYRGAWLLVVAVGGLC